jgi:PKD repeat protein
MRARGHFFAVFVAVLVVAGLAPMSSAMAAESPPPAVGQASITSGATTAAAPTSIQHVVWLWLENRSYSNVIGSTQAPYINSLAKTYGSATNAWAITHPSAPNYVGGTSGLPLSKLPATDCTTCTQPGPDLFTQVSSWRAYQESMTTPCRRTQDSGGLYVPRHNPALYFTDITAASCQANDVPYSVLADDLARHTLPAFSFITPNLNNDMHDGNIPAGDAWVKANLPSILNSPEFTSGATVVFLTFDEGAGGGTLKGVDCTTSTSESCHIPLVVISPYSVGTSSTRKLTLYSVLKATEDLLGVPELGQAATAPDLLTDFGLSGPKAPVASFSSTCTYRTCTFDASGSTAPGSSISSYAWTFGDAGTGTGANPSHSYATSGSYPVTLTVTAANGLQASTTQSVSPTDPPPPVASFTSQCAGLSCTFDASASSAVAGIASVSWDFGDGTAGSGPVASHSFGAEGTYPVTLTVTDAENRSTTLTQQVIVTAPSPAQLFVQCTLLHCTADASASTLADPTGYHFDFGDGTSAEASSAIVGHAYSVAGSYVVSVTVINDSGDAATTSTSIAVSGATATFTPSCTALSCTFDASASTAPGATITDYAWDFGDGSTGSGSAVVAHTYVAGGTYPVQLTITDSTGDHTTVQQSVSVAPAATSIGFVNSDAANANAKTESVTIPSSVHAGDALVLVASSAVATPQTTPSGWQVVKTASTASMYSTVWQRVATAADPGSVVTVTFGTTLVKGSLQVLAYTGTASAAPVASAVSRSGSTSLTSFATPPTTVTVPGSWVLSGWFARSTYATTWLSPAGLVVRSRSDGTGGAHIDAMLADPGAPAAAGTVAGSTASTDQATGNQIAWSIVLLPRG